MGTTKETDKIEFSSEYYEDKTIEAVADGRIAEAQVFAQLTVAASVREASDLVVEAFDGIEIENDEEDEDAIDEDEEIAA